MSPWEATRLSLEAQRIMAFHFLHFASGQERRQGQALTSRLVDQSAVASMEPAAPARSMATGRPETVRKSAAVVGKPTGAKEHSRSKVKDKRLRRKEKSR
jgi:hypothetical protein